jgi:hypothetical protein
MTNEALMTNAQRRFERFTLDGSDELEEHLEGTCEMVLAGVLEIVSPRRLEALLLGGGYGRGEGGVLKTEAGDQPYNDLEFYVCLRGPHWLNERRYGAALHGLAETLSGIVGVDVEFKMLPLWKLRSIPVSMFYYDLVMRNRRLWGTERLLDDCSHHRDAAQIPLAEATRLLMNRCSGLLFAKERLQHDPFTSEDADFVGRNLAKVQLAFGDAMLTVYGQYHWSCGERAERLRRINSEFERLVEVQRHHRAGVQFKLHPERTASPRSLLQERHQELSELARELWLWLESRRLDHSFQSIRSYAQSPHRKCPETKRWRNCLVNLKTFGPRALFSRRLTHYPREQVLEALALLLWTPDVCDDPDLLQRVQSALATSSGTFPELVHAYRSVWGRFN